MPRRSAETASRPLPNGPLLASALAGMAIAGYLAASHWLETTPVGCEAGSACSAVQASRFASLLGLPVAAWGSALYAALALIAVSVRDGRLHSRLALGLSGSGFAVSLYLTAVSILELGAVCAWCVGSLGTVTACFAIALVQARPSVPRRVLCREIGAIAAVSGILLTALHVHWSGPAAQPEEATKLRELALHLRATGARFYGASWCRTCLEQKALFGDAASLLPYVECSPNGRRGPKAAPCRDAGIAFYPTWIVAGRRHEGLMNVDSLATLSGFDWPASPRMPSGDADVDRSD